MVQVNSTFTIILSKLSNGEVHHGNGIKFSFV